MYGEAYDASVRMKKSLAALQGKPSKNLDSLHDTIWEQAVRKPPSTFQVHSRCNLGSPISTQASTDGWKVLMCVKESAPSWVAFDFLQAQLMKQEVSTKCEDMLQFTPILSFSSLLFFSCNYSSFPRHRPADSTCLRNHFLPSGPSDFSDSFPLTCMYFFTIPSHSTMFLLLSHCSGTFRVSGI